MSQHTKEMLIDTLILGGLVLITALFAFYESIFKKLLINTKEVTTKELHQDHATPQIGSSL